jgi:GNAT superfamily N-acetyltransferase
VTFHPLTPGRWQDLEALFGANGACGGCWCMWWRLKRAEFEKGKGAGNRRAFQKLVAAGGAPGLLAYDGARPVGWVAAAPREEFVRLEGSKLLAKVDAQPVWSIVCLFIARPYRRRGLMARLLRAAAEHARAHGATLVEGYPVEPAKRTGDAFVYTGIASSFREAGFVEVARRSPTRPIMRMALTESAASPPSSRAATAPAPPSASAR